MGRLCLVVCLAILFAAGGTSAAQAGFGFKAGPNMANLHGDDAENLDWKIGLAAGGFLNLSLTPIVSLQPELLYVQNGASLDGIFGINVKFSLDYFQLPLLAKFDIPVVGTIVPTLYAGPYVGFLSSAEVTASLGGWSETIDIKDYVSSTDYGFVLGGAMEFGLGLTSLFFEGRYVHGLAGLDDGLSDAFENDEPQETDLKNRSIMLLVGFSF